MSEEYLLLIDGSSLLSTQFYGNLPREILFAKTPEEKEKYYHKIMMTSRGVYTNAVFGFLRTLFNILKKQQPTYLAVAWDLSRDTFRRKLYPQYKANRSETMKPLSDQFDLCQKTLEELGIVQLMSTEFEADDYCGTAARLFEGEVPVRILTKDQDYLQLVTDRTHLWMMHNSQDKTDELYRKYRIDPSSVNAPDRAFELDPALVLSEYGVEPESINSLKGLQGDSSDNIKGVPGVGPATAVKLIAHYKTVDALYKDLEVMDKQKEAAVKKFWKEELGITRSPLNFLLKTSEEELVGERSARLSEELATIRRDIDLGGLQLSDMRVDIKKAAADSVLKKLEFSSLNADFLESTEEKIRPEEQFSEITDTDEAEKIYKKLLKEKACGLCYEAGVGLSLASADGTTVLIREGFFMDRTYMKRLVTGLSEAGVTLYAFSGKVFEKMAGAAVRDTGVAAYLLSPLNSAYEYNDIASEYLSLELPARESLLGKALPADLCESDFGAVLKYMGFSAYTALNAGPVLEKALSDRGMLKLYEEIELPVMRILARMEDRGILVKRDELEAFSDELKQTLNSLTGEIYELAGEEFNINSPKQLASVLFEKMKLPYGKKTKSGYSTAADILEKLAPDYPIVEKILTYRTYSKLNSTYAEGLQSFIAEDGRIHGTFHQTVTATGRLSSANPNLQNIPVRLELGRKIRKVFVPAEGCVFVDADYSQIELRVLASMSGDENLIAAYRDARDVHAITASQVFGVPLEEVTPEMRRNAKAVNFGIVYGISAFGLSDNLSISREEAKQYMESYFRTYPGIEAYLEGLVASAKADGYVKTLYGRIRPIPELESSNFNQRSFGERVAMNSPIQGTAADIMKLAMIRVEKALEEAGLRSKIVLQIHDELLIEAPEEEAEEAERILIREMESAADLAVRLEVSANRGYSWYDTK